MRMTIKLQDAKGSLSEARKRLLRVSIDALNAAVDQFSVAETAVVAGPPVSTSTEVSDSRREEQRQEIKLIEDRAFKSYKARIVMAERLSRRGKAWDAALIALATSTTVASIALLSDPLIFGDRGATLLAALAVVSLVLSLVVSNANYGLRSAKTEANYKSLQRISLEAERLRLSEFSQNQLEVLREKASGAIESSENHSAVDFLRSINKGLRTLPVRLDSIWTSLPLAFLLVPAALFVVVARWFFHV